MKSLKSFVLKINILFCLTVLFTNSSNAQVEYVSNSLNGANINTSSTLFFPDPLSCISPGSCGNITACSYLSYVALEIGPLTDPSITYQSGVYSIEVEVEIDYTGNDGTVVTGASSTLNIGFNKDGGTFVNKDRVSFYGGYGTNMSITSVTYKDPDDNVLPVDDIPIEASLFLGSLIDRYEPLTLAENDAVIDYPNSGMYDHFINISWSNITGASSYDLEWLWVDTEFIDPDADQFNFKYNSTRINTENTFYKISNIYRKGALIFRIRAIGRTNDCENYVAGVWSQTDKGDYSDLVDLGEGGYILLNGHQENFNWQHSRIYAEEGKHKDAITYFDGTMRSRQSVSRLESDNHAIVSESYYDHVGRATVQALPAPFIQGTNYAQNIDYYDNFNTSNNNPYNKTHFEKDDASCISIPDAMDASGSGQYYSSSNTITDGHQAYVPDAFGFPITQVIYTQDQTGRVRFQGGVGSTHQIGQGHETKFYYGVPEQEEIDRLFGNDVGYVQYYEKNLVVDPNGQVSISYLDNENRVIATALAGAVPAQLDALPSYSNPVNNFIVNSPLSTLNTLINEGTRDASLSIFKQFPVSSDGSQYSYNYSFTPQDFTDPECAPDICFDCAYDLKLVVYDECGNIVMKNDVDSGSINPTTIDGDCETNPDHTVPLSESLNIGSYGINKKLSLDNEIMNAYEKLYVEAYQCIISEAEIFDNLISDADLSGCIDEACLDLCRTEIDATDYSNNPDGYVAAITSCLEAKIASGECMTAEGEDINQCEAFKVLLISDMSPFGQYGTVTNSANEIQRFGLPCTSFYAEDNIFGISYDDPSLNYGGITVEINGMPTSPKDMSLSEFTTYVKESWLTEILPFHPEYVYLSWCEIENVASQTFDEQLLKLSAEDAKSMGYLNPHGDDPGTIGYDIGGISNGLEIPGAIVSGMPTEDFAALRNDMLLFIEFENENITRNYTIWDVSYIIALSNILDINQILQGTPPLPGMWDDVYGDQLCRSERFWEIFRSFYASLKLRHSIGALDIYFADNASLLAKAIKENNCFGATEDCQGCDQWGTILQRYFGYGSIVDENGEIVEGDLSGGLNYDEILNGMIDPDAETTGQLLAECQNICGSYRDQWAEELQGCGFDQTELNLLLEEMVAICAAGCDPTHLLGASNDPVSGDSFRSAIETALAGTLMSEICNDLLITNPPPYDTDIFGGTQPFIDQCVCDRYNKVYEEYSVGQPNPDFDGFYTYLQSTYDVTYESQVLTDLDCACRSVESPFLLDNPTGTFGIPEPFACIACIACDQANVVYDEFLASDYNYFGNITSETLENPNFRSVLTTWLNQELNFNLSFNEYIDFFAYCDFGVSALAGGQQLQGMQLPGVSYDTYAMIEDRMVRKDDPEYKAFIKSMANSNIIFELKANQSTTQAGGTVSYDITITNTGSESLVFDYYDPLPGGWTFTAFPTDLNGGTLNSVIGDNDMSVTNVSLDANATILWTVSTKVTEQAYIARKYYHQARIIENAANSPDTTYSDDPVTTGIYETMDPTGVFLEVDDPCLGPVEEADDLVDFLNEIIAFVGTDPVYPIEIPINSLTSFGPNSSLNIWPYLNPENINLIIPDPAMTNGVITLMFVNDCGIADLLCPLSLNGIADLSEITMVHEASSLGVVDADGNYVLQLDITKSNGIETTILASSCYDLRPCDKRRLCNRSITFEAEPVANCLDYVFDILALQASEEYETLINEAIERFQLGYSLQCMGVQDQLDQSFTSREYHHTLYYYDQSGSLVRTVPPKGVKVLFDKPSMNIFDLTNVDEHRKGNFPDAVYPEHEYRTDYQFNSQNQPILQDSPDATEMEFFYDRLGRVVASQDGRQREIVYPKHSYTIYDEQGRVIETGEIIHAGNHPLRFMTSSIAFNEADFNIWLNAGSERVQVVKSIYDENLEDAGSGLNIDSYFDAPRIYLRKRISSSLFFESYQPGDLDYDHASHYDYDVHGNVKTLIQEFASLKNINQHLKYIEYDYDLVSGNVHQVSYQKGDVDAFYHRYTYDADNRIIQVATSHDAFIWDKDATYQYYDHGPLARTELGEYKVQGSDYAYTIQGWVKGVNSNTLIEDRDIGGDGESGGIHELLAADVYGYSLGYYTNDYTPVASQTNNWLAAEPDLSNKDLFNGNIRSMVTAIKKPDGSLLENIPSVYTYDQLQRIKSMQKYTAIDAATNSWATAGSIDSYQSTYTYDPNGNLLSLTRHNNEELMDDLSYVYPDGQNRLEWVDDGIGASVVEGDFDPQAEENYTYDNTGNLIKDASGEIANIEWNTYGKVKQITRNEGVDLSEKPNVNYQYDATGNRIIKRVESGGTPNDWTYTYYVRDADGNVMGVYKGLNTSTVDDGQVNDFFEKEFHIYGSNRLGIKKSDKPDQDLENLAIAPVLFNRFAGNRSYELSNHLGNVLAGISDNKLLAYQGSSLPLYKAEVQSYSDYYPFGLEMPDRNASSVNYRYGFNGKEKDENGEWGTQTHYDYGFRIYNPSIGKFLSVDPLTKSYPYYTPYQFAGNKPIWSIDVDGLEEFKVTGLGGAEGTVYGPYADQGAAQSATDKGEAVVTYNLPEVLISSSNSSQENNFALQFTGGLTTSAINGSLRLYYAGKSRMLKGPLYEKGLPLKLNNVFGAFERFRIKDFTRNLTIGGRAHLDFIDPNGLKFGTRFWFSSPFVNSMGALGVTFGSLHIYSSGKTLLSLNNSQDRFKFILAESARNIGAINQMHAASQTYSSISIRSSLLTNYKNVNIFGGFTYSWVRGAIGSFGAGMLTEGLIHGYEILESPYTNSLWNHNNLNNSATHLQWDTPSSLRRINRPRRRSMLLRMLDAFGSQSGNGL